MITVTSKTPRKTSKGSNQMSSWEVQTAKLNVQRNKPELYLKALEVPGIRYNLLSTLLEEKLGSKELLSESNQERLARLKTMIRSPNLSFGPGSLKSVLKKK